MSSEELAQRMQRFKQQRAATAARPAPAAPGNSKAGVQLASMSADRIKALLRRKAMANQ
jgi:hypothetical protein